MTKRAAMRQSIIFAFDRGYSMKYHRGPSPLYLNSTIYDWLWSHLHPLDSFFYHSYLLLYILSTLRRKWTFSHCSKTTSGLSAFEEYFDDKDGLDRSTTVLDDYTPDPNAYYCTTATFFFGIFGTYVTPLYLLSCPQIFLEKPYPRLHCALCSLTLAGTPPCLSHHPPPHNQHHHHHHRPHHHQPRHLTIIMIMIIITTTTLGLLDVSISFNQLVQVLAWLHHHMAPLMTSFNFIQCIVQVGS